MNLLTRHDIRSLVGKLEPSVSLYTSLTGDMAYDRKKLQDAIDLASGKANEAFPIRSSSFQFPSAEELLRKTEKFSGVRGLAVFRSPSIAGFRPMYKFFEESLVISDSFHLKPFFMDIQLSSHYFLVSLTRDRVQLFEGSSDGCEHLKTFVASDKELDRLDSAEITTREQVKVWNRFENMRLDRATIKFYKSVDTAIRRQILTSGVPVILVGLEKMVMLFRNVNRHRSPIVATFAQKFDSLKQLHDIHIRSLHLLEEYHRRRALSGALEYRNAKRLGRSIDNVNEIAVAASKGQIKCLLIRSGSKLWGKLNRKTGRISLVMNHLQEGVDDVSDDLGEMVLKNRGQVFILKPDEMPSMSPIAAVLTSQWSSSLSFESPDEASQLLAVVGVG